MLLKYHQARNTDLLGRVFWRRLNVTAGWLDELEHPERQTHLSAYSSLHPHN
jgi:hypothetical protein